MAKKNKGFDLKIYCKEVIRISKLQRIAPNKRVGQLYVLACKRVLSDFSNKQYFYDDREPKIIEKFISFLRHPDGEHAGQNFILADWQKFIVYSIYGFFKQKNGNRKYNELYLEVARKNGKTAFMAALVLYHFMVDKFRGHQIFLASTKMEQSDICYRFILNFYDGLKKDYPELDNSKQFQKLTGKFPVFRNNENNAFVKPLSKNVKDGDNPSLAIIDEFHEHPDTKVIDALVTGMIARANPFTFITTTAGFKKVSPCGKKRIQQIKILKGLLEAPQCFPCIFSLDKEDKRKKEGEGWRDWKNWKKPNPSLHETVLFDNLMARYKLVKKSRGDELRAFKTKNLNMWEDEVDAFIESDEWTSAGVMTKKQLKSLKGKDCFVGIDLGRTSDFTAMAIFFPNVFGENKHAECCYIFCPKVKLTKQDDFVDYTPWIEKGFITLSGDKVIDHTDVANKMIKILEKFEVKGLGIDAYAIGHGVLTVLEEKYQITKVAQTTVSLHSPTNELKEICLEKKLKHLYNPVMAWMVSNATIVKDRGGNIKIDKQTNQGKIDGVDALINAIKIFVENPDYEMVLA